MTVCVSCSRRVLPAATVGPCINSVAQLFFSFFPQSWRLRPIHKSIDDSKTYGVLIYLSIFSTSKMLPETISVSKRKVLHLFSSLLLLDLVFRALSGSFGGCWSCERRRLRLERVGDVTQQLHLIHFEFHRPNLLNRKQREKKKKKRYIACLFTQQALTHSQKREREMYAHE